MSSLEHTIARYRSLRLSATAEELANLLPQAEVNEMSYLSFADRLAAFPVQKLLEAFDYHHHQASGERPAGLPVHR